ncbi:MAG: methyl-accepting chemotaxis protein [Pseudomonadota bacterium]|jgi:methyl-accepting chemotaxis protein
MTSSVRAETAGAGRSLSGRLYLGLAGIAALVLGVAGVAGWALQRSEAGWMQLLSAAAGTAAPAVPAATLAALQADQQYRLGALGVSVAVALLALLVIGRIMVKSLQGSIDRTIDSARRIADGDLTHEIAVDPGGDLGELQQAVAQMQDRLRQMVGSLRDTTDSIATASSQIAHGNADLSQRTEQTAGSLQQTASSMEQLSGTVRSTADSARAANGLVQTAVEAAQRGGEVVSQVVSNMEDISTSSRKIAEIIGVIDGIAFQTNILALNAAVEAARAGEQGRGFAVVAGEVRGLAQRAATAAKEIKTLINASVEKVESGGKLVRDAGATMDAIVTSVQHVTQIIGEISTATGEQSAGLSHVSQSVVQLDQMTQQNAALVGESASAAESLRMQAERLQKVVSAFRLLQQTQEAAWTAHTTISGARKSAKVAMTAPAPLTASDVHRPAAAPKATRPTQQPPKSPPARKDDGDWESF